MTGVERGGGDVWLEENGGKDWTGSGRWSWGGSLEKRWAGVRVELMLLL